MTKKFTQINQLSMKLCLSLFMLIGALMPKLVSAQTYCTPGTYYGCSYSGSNYGCIERIKISDPGANVLFDKAADGCNYGVTSAVGSAGNGYSFVTQTPKFTLSAGTNYKIDVGVSFLGSGYGMYVGCWIDLNGNGVFESGDYMNKSAWTVTSSTSPGTVGSWNFTLPCNVKTGATRMRLACSYSYTYNANSACATGTTFFYGEWEDHAINLALPTSLAAGFYMPATAFTGTVVNMVNANQTGYISHQWDINDDNTVEYNSTNAAHTFTTSGSKSVRLKSSNCLGRDSILKTISIVDPSFAPVADFVGDKVEVEKFGTVKFTDLSTNGPTYWNWVIWDPRDSLGSSASINSVNFNLVGGDPYVNANPNIFFQMEGTYNVCLQTSNSKGPSAWKCKTAYLRVTPFKDITLGPIKQSFESNGNIIDNGGRTGNYSNKRIDDFAIIPCQAKKIKLKFSQFKLQTGDFLRVYDGFDASGIPIHKGTGFTAGSLLKDSTLVANSGAMYLYFTSNASGNDSGFIATWTTEKGSAATPEADFFAPDTMYNNVDYTIYNYSRNVLGQTEYTWAVDGVDESFSKDFPKTFYTDNTYRVCLTAKTCTGTSTYCKNIVIVTPHSKAKFDFEASNRRPVTGENVNFKLIPPAQDKALKVNRFKWTFFPSTISFVSSTDASMDPIVKFNAKGSYTVSLRAWNNLDSALTSNVVIKGVYVVVVEPCTPIVSVSTSSDVAIHNVTLLSATGKELINNSSNIGNGYDDYTATVPSAKLLFGGNYKANISRLTTINPINRKVWVDWNIDGDFEDAGELIATENAAQTTSWTANINVPNISTSFEGKTRMRVGVSYQNDPNEPCGAGSGVTNANRIGEFEDYAVLLTRDTDIPVITLNGDDTLFLQVGTTYTELGAVAMDETQGDITSSIITVSDVDMALTGIYYVTYNVKDASGNSATQRTRVVYVVIDQTKPVLTLNGSNPMTLEVFTPYVEDGATATDNRDGSLTNSIVTTGSVNSNVVGVYNITYTVRDAQGNSATKIRTVNIVDTQKPVISNSDADVNNEVKVQIVSIFVDRTVVTDNYYNVNLVATPGAAGDVNTKSKGRYPVTYTAIDGSNNAATPVTFTYIVDDYIAPEIDLHTLDTVMHKVYTPYVSVAASVSDNFYNNTQVSLTKASNVNSNVLGLYYDEYTATDASGNVFKKKRFVRVFDGEAPIIYGEAVCVGLFSKFDASKSLTFADNYDNPTLLKANLKVLSNNLNTDKIGVYTLSYITTDASGNQSAPFTQTVWVTRDCETITSGVDNLALNGMINVYPNPSNGIVNIGFNFGSKHNVAISIYNNMGELVKNVINTNTNVGTYQVDMTAETAGLYLVRMTVDGKSTTKSVLITK